MPIDPPEPDADELDAIDDVAEFDELDDAPETVDAERPGNAADGAFDGATDDELDGADDDADLDLDDDPEAALDSDAAMLARARKKYGIGGAILAGGMLGLDRMLTGKVK